MSEEGVELALQPAKLQKVQRCRMQQTSQYFCMGSPAYLAPMHLLQAAAGAGRHGLSASGCGGGDDHWHNLQLQSRGSSHNIGGGLQEEGAGGERRGCGYLN